jgi:hypothetical protein
MLLEPYILQFHGVLNLKTVSTFIRYAHTREYKNAGVGTENFIIPKIRKVSRYSLRNDVDIINRLSLGCFFKSQNYKLYERIFKTL